MLLLSVKKNVSESELTENNESDVSNTINEEEIADNYSFDDEEDDFAISPEENDEQLRLSKRQCRRRYRNRY